MSEMDVARKYGLDIKDVDIAKAGDIQICLRLMVSRISNHAHSFLLESEEKLKKLEELGEDVVELSFRQTYSMAQYLKIAQDMVDMYFEFEEIRTLAGMPPAGIEQ